MTEIKVQYKGKSSLIEVKGHTGYADNGYDIVCAAISTSCILSANLIERFHLGYSIIDLVCDDGYFRLEVNTGDSIAVTIFENLVDSLNELQKQYPKYIKYRN